MKLELKYVATGVIFGCMGLTSVFAASKIKQAVTTNVGLVFEGKQQEQSQKMIAVQFEGQGYSTAYVNMNAFLNALSLEGEYDKSRNAFVIVNNGWSTKTPIKAANTVPLPSSSAVRRTRSSPISRNAPSTQRHPQPLHPQEAPKRH